MESPYRTDCKDYRFRFSGKYLSRKGCIRKCKIEVSLKTCGVIYRDIDLMRSDPTVHFGNWGNSTSKSCFQNLNYTYVCNERCPHYDCAIDYYKTVALHKVKNTKGTFLTLVIPTEPETSYSHEPRIELVEFICYLASTFNMWFGFSMLSLYYLFTVFRNRVKNKINKNSGNQPDNLFDKIIVGPKLSEDSSELKARKVKLQKVKRIIVMVINILLSFGCFYQILDVCKLYFEYPTNIFIESNFDFLVNTLPAITFSVKLKAFNDGLNSTHSLNKASQVFKHKLFKSIIIEKRNVTKNMKNIYLNKAIERINFDRYFITFNSKLTGRNFNNCVNNFMSLKFV